MCLKDSKEQCWVDKSYLPYMNVYIHPHPLFKTLYVPYSKSSSHTISIYAKMDLMHFLACIHRLKYQVIMLPYKHSLAGVNSKQWADWRLLSTCNKIAYHLKQVGRIITIPKTSQLKYEHDLHSNNRLPCLYDLPLVLP